MQRLGEEGLKVLVLGCGRMGSALARSCARRPGTEVRALVRDVAAASARVSGACIDVIDEMPERTAWAADVVVLALKPQAIAEAAPGLEAATEGALLVSVAAGVTLAGLSTLFPRARAIVRAMPNLAVAEGRGMTALCGGAPADRFVLERLLAASGQLAWVESEDALDLATAVSGSGPAYFFALADALHRAAEARGMPPELAALLARQTLIGSAALMGRGMRPMEIAQQVASPGGTTAAGLAVLGQDEALSRLISEAVGAAADRARELRSVTP